MIGCGQISERFFKQAETRDDVEFVATCAKHLESAENKAREHGIDKWYDDYEKMMDEVKPDGVVVTTPHSVHAAPAIAALKRGIHVLDEKPMATTLEDCEAMVQAADDNDAILMCLPFDHSPAFLTALDYINEETIGKFTGAESLLIIPGPYRDNWYMDKSVAHGGAMLDCVVYPMSRLISMLGPASRVTAFANNLIPHRICGNGAKCESNVDDNTSLLVEWADGQQAVVRTLWGTSFWRNDTTVYGRKGTIWFLGESMVIHSPEKPIPGGEPIVWQGFDNCYSVQARPDIKAESMIDHFADCIRDHAEPKCSGHLQLHVHEILFKAYKSVETGQTQDLTTTFTPWHPIDRSFYDTRDGWI
ncbi:MAG: Gfo/Idh/MocA family protein [Armatimonadota bacterium]